MIYFLFDIETIKDYDLLEKAGSEKDKEKADNGEFVNAVFHIPIAFSFMAFSERKLLGFKSYVGEERYIVKIFWEKVNKAFTCKEPGPVFVTFNGKNFDFPVMLLRGMKIKDDEIVKKALKYYLEDSDKWEKERPNYNSRYTRYHIDLMEVFNVRTSLKVLCSLFGIPVKTEAHGSEVEELYRNKKFKKIAQYCAEDVLATARLFTVFTSMKTGQTFNFLREKIDVKIINQWSEEDS
ncbi:ribonuclease H-like domain-containing protein [Desulfurobacterium atlanticum]|uniref:Predicted 3'-5' exonuclease PolB-like domain-containing protein n=1 Tax=Desulfurobacterium atlanticum TaxID=240169 RepID=A0A238YTD7_9BACT|nr:ribonuclease H-like domain-containing protein [Desulfurobacterium atlanticum]SNR73719.1 hypothetical protein SAMN06265340_104135 [Desulfurobacterium atlanticum]